MNLRVFLFLSLMSMFPFSKLVVAEVEHFENDPALIHEDPAYLPGEYVMPDTNQARMVYHLKKTELIEAIDQFEGVAWLSASIGDVTFTSVKNETAEVLGSFRNYFGAAFIRDGTFESFKMIVDLNSLDTGVPGRNNRIMALFFKSMMPDLGTAEITFQDIESSLNRLDNVQPGHTTQVRAHGHLFLNGLKQPVEAVLQVEKMKVGWQVESLEPIEILISDFGFQGEILSLLESCNHQSIGNRVLIKVSLRLR